MIGVPVQGTFVLIVGVWPNRWRRLFGSLPIRNAPPVLRHPVPVALTHLRASFRCSYEKCFRCHNEFPDVFNHRISVLVACHCDKLCSAGQFHLNSDKRDLSVDYILHIFYSPRFVPTNLQNVPLPKFIVISGPQLLFTNG